MIHTNFYGNKVGVMLLLVPRPLGPSLASSCLVVRRDCMFLQEFVSSSHFLVFSAWWV